MKVPASFARGAVLVTLFLLLVFTLAACWGGGEEEEPAPAALPAAESALPGPGEQAQLRCSEACASRGNCGNTLNQGPYVLLGRNRPIAASGQHDMAVPAETLVTVSEVRTETIVLVSGQEQPQDFFRVFVPEKNAEGWVASWCIVRAP